jgi:glycerol-3-phosphate acyltransferase PlsY
VAGLILSIASVVMLFKHLENIKRILNGTEVGFRSAHKGKHRLK